MNTMKNHTPSAPDFDSLCDIPPSSSPSSAPHDHDLTLYLQGLSSVPPSTTLPSQSDIPNSPASPSGLNDLLSGFLCDCGRRHINKTHSRFISSLRGRHPGSGVRLWEVGGEVYGLVDSSSEGLRVFKRGRSRGGPNHPKHIATYAPIDVARLKAISEEVAYGGEDTYWSRYRSPAGLHDG